MARTIAVDVQYDGVFGDDARHRRRRSPGFRNADDVAAAAALARPIPELPPNDPAAFLDSLTRARIEALGRALHAASMLHRAFAAVERAAQGIDDALATRAAEAAFVHRERVVAAAGDLWES